MIDERTLRDYYIIIIIGCLHFSAAAEEDSEKMEPINIKIVIKEHRVYAPPCLPLQGPILNIHAVGSGRALSSWPDDRAKIHNLDSYSRNLLHSGYFN